GPTNRVDLRFTTTVRIVRTMFRLVAETSFARNLFSLCSHDPDHRHFSLSDWLRWPHSRRRTRLSTQRGTFSSTVLFRRTCRISFIGALHRFENSVLCAHSVYLG